MFYSYMPELAQGRNISEIRPLMQPKIWASSFNEFKTPYSCTKRNILEEYILLSIQSELLVNEYSSVEHYAKCLSLYVTEYNSKQQPVGDFLQSLINQAKDLIDPKHYVNDIIIDVFKHFTKPLSNGIETAFRKGYKDAFDILVARVKDHFAEIKVMLEVDDAVNVPVAYYRKLSL